MTDWRTDWREQRNEYIAGRLLDQDDEQSWRDAQRDDDLGVSVWPWCRWVSEREQRESWADDRAAVEGECAVAAELERVARWQGMWRDAT